jgi:hypothetical protein
MRHSSPEALAAHEAALKAYLIDAIKAMTLASFLTERAASALWANNLCPSLIVRLHVCM